MKRSDLLITGDLKGKKGGKPSLEIVDMLGLLKAMGLKGMIGEAAPLVERLKEKDSTSVKTS